MTEEAGRAEGLLDSLRNLAKTFVALLQTRLEIFASEIDEGRARLAKIAVLAAVAAFCLGLAVVLLVFFLVMLFWDTNRLLAIGVLTGVFAAGGIAACRGLVVVVDRGIAWASWLRARPYAVVIAAAAIALLRPRLALGWSARLLTLWRVGRFLYSAIKPAAG